MPRVRPLLLELDNMQKGWPARISESLKPFHNRKMELTLEGGRVLWGIRVVVPQKC